MKKSVRNILIAVCAIALVCAGAVIFLPAFNGIYSVVIALLLIIALLVWKTFIKDGRKELRESRQEVENLKKTIHKLDRELEEKNRSRFNVVGLNPILHVAVLDVDTSFVRPYVREDERLTFNGALRADMKVEYGIKLEEVKFRYDSANRRLTLANFHPGIISYSRKQLSWEFAKTFKSTRILGHELPEVSDKEAELYTRKMCEQLRNELEQEIDSRQVEEFAWLSPLITNQVMDVLQLMTGDDHLEIAITDAPDENFISLPELRRQIAGAEIRPDR